MNAVHLQPARVAAVSGVNQVLVVIFPLITLCLGGGWGPVQVPLLLSPAVHVKQPEISFLLQPHLTSALLICADGVSC